MRRISFSRPALVAMTFLMSMTCVSSFAHSEDSADAESGMPTSFYTQGSVLDMSIPLEETEQPDFEFGTSKGIRPKPDPKLEAKVVTAKTSTGETKSKQPSKDGRSEPGSKGTDSLRSKLQEEYGDPKEETPIAGIPTSPKPYRAMLAALNEGREDLALEYGEQWIRYMNRMKEVSTKAAAIAELMNLDPSRADEDLSNSARSKLDPAAVAEHIAKHKQESAVSTSATDVEINDQSKQQIQAFFGNEAKAQLNLSDKLPEDPYANLFNLFMDEESRRLLIRSTLAGKLPSEPSGEVQVLFFVKPGDQLSISVGKEVAKVLRSTNLGVNLNVVPLSVSGLDFKQTQDFLRQTGIQAMLRDGSSLIKTLGKSFEITQFPSLLFVSSNSEKAFLRSGVADSVFIEEIAKMIGGK